MKPPPILFIIFSSLLSGILLFDQTLGINIPVFIVSLSVMWYLNRAGWLFSRNARITLRATILAALAIAAGYSSYAIMTFLILMLATIGTLAFSQAPLPASLIHGVYTLITSHLVILTDNRQPISSGKAMRVLKVSMVPVLVAIAFFLMYYLGNPAFAALMNNFTPGAPGAFFWFCLWSGVFLFGTFYINENWAGMLLEKKLPDYLS